MKTWTLVIVDNFNKHNIKVKRKVDKVFYAKMDMMSWIKRNPLGKFEEYRLEEHN